MHFAFADAASAGAAVEAIVVVKTPATSMNTKAMYANFGLELVISHPYLFPVDGPELPARSR